MRISRGFTLIELMIVVVVVALLAAIGYPSYREHIARGQRSQGQQFLADLAQKEEQILLDRRQYVDMATLTALGFTPPEGFKYALPTVTPANGPPPTFTACMAPVSGSYLESRGDGRLCINNAGERWREKDGNSTFDKTSPTTDCAWENRSCVF